MQTFDCVEWNAKKPEADVLDFALGGNVAAGGFEDDVGFAISVPGREVLLWRQERLRDQRVLRGEWGGPGENRYNRAGEVLGEGRSW